MNLVDWVIVLSLPAMAYICACAGKLLFMPYRCARFGCWREQCSITRLCRHHLRRRAGLYPGGRL